MSKQFSTKQGTLTYTLEGNYQENSDGSWSEAVPLPFYGLRKVCQCGRSFWRETNYQKHYREVHTDGKKYKRNVTGFEAQS